MPKNILDKAKAKSFRYSRQVWIIWRVDGYHMLLAWRRGDGVLIARVCGDEVFSV